MNAAAHWKSTQDRRRQILSAALECFSDLGFAGTTLEDIRAKSGASTGSIYHHFESKEKLAAALFVEGIKHYQHTLLEELKRFDGAEQTVRRIVSHYLRWVEQHTTWARYLLAMGHAVFLESARSEIDQINAEFFEGLASRLQPHVARGAVQNLTPAVFAALLLGPSREFARRYVEGGTRRAMREARRVLPAAAWEVLRTKQRDQKHHR